MLKTIYDRFRGKGEVTQHSTFHVSQGDAHNARKEWSFAIDHYRKALAIDATLTAIWIQLGHALRETDDFTTAEEAYRQALLLDVDNVDGLFFLGVTLHKMGKHNGAFKTLLRALSLKPDGPAGRELANLTGIEDDFRDFHEAVEALFDSDHYIKGNSDLRQAGIDPKLHYMMYGWKEGRAPSAFFDPTFYKQHYRKLFKTYHHPLVHYWKVGRALNLRSNPVSDRLWFEPKVPSDAEWAGLASAMFNDTTRAVVIIPVYKGYDETLAAVYHAVHARGDSPYSLLVINDCGPEERLNVELERLAGLGLFDYTVNSSNRGFVQTCNRGILELSDDRDIILLNSDAYVPPGWFDRMIAHADKDPSIATITPLSNNATICSYPLTDADNFRALELSPIDLDVLAAKTNPGLHAETPTGVGFCFYMRRTVIDKIGALDPVAFKVGYGEENDFCMRSFEAGYKNIIAADIFVFHVGSVSFSSVKDANYAAGQRALDVKHPNYTLLTRRHVAADPTHYGRQRLDKARLLLQAKGAVVFITHTWGGGIETYLDVKRAELAASGTPYIMLAVRDRCFVSLETSEKSPIFVPNLSSIDLRIDFGLLCELLKDLEPSLLHINSFAGLDWPYHDAFLSFIAGSGIPYRYIAHDYSAISRFYQLIRPDYIYGGAPNWETLEQWSRMGDKNASDVCSIDARRRAYSAFLQKAECVEFPSQAVRDIYESFYSGFASEVVPHSRAFKTKERASRRRRDGKLRIASIGAIGPHKGSDVILALARDAATRDLKIEYSIVGYTDQDTAMTAAGVTVTGAYASEEEAIDALQALQPDLVFIASVWPETYCYTLSIPLALGMPFMVFDLGAQAERAAMVSWSRRLDPALINAPNKLSEDILNIDVDLLWRAAKDETDGLAQDDRLQKSAE